MNASLESETERVTRRLRGEILDGARKPGERLVERELAGALDVSRVPVREGLADALHPAFAAAAVVSLAVWVIAVVWVKEVPLRRSVDELSAVEAAAGTPAEAAEQPS